MMIAVAVGTFLLAAASVGATNVGYNAGKRAGYVMPAHHPQHSAPRDLLQRIAKTNPASLTGAQGPPRRSFVAGLRVTPSTFGADPTGRKESWAALNACIEVCLNQSALSPNGYFPGQDTTPSFGPIRDAGGCDIDLEGGEYLLSRTLHLPNMTANMQFGRGSLVASHDFDGDFLFVVGVKGACRVPQGSCNIDINFPELFLDGAHVASGLQINDVMGVTVGPGGYFLNFTEYGLQINAGHEVMMDRCWLGETNFDFDHEKMGVTPNATAIQINGNDHYILNSIVFSSKIGLEVNGAADYIQGVHVWFPVNHAVHFADTIAFHNKGGGNRFMGCYMDGGRAIFTSTALHETIWTNGFECCQNGAPAPGTTASGITLVGDTVGPGLQIMNNEFGGGSIYHCSEAAFAAGQCAAESAARRRGDYAAPPPKDCKSLFNVSVSGLDCQGLTQQQGIQSLSACAAACCKLSTCSAYQWCPPGVQCDGLTPGPAGLGECWTGSFAGCGGSRKGWQGKGFAGPVPPTPSTVTGVRIAHNYFQRNGVSTQATKQLTQTAATKWVFDFCDVLLFPQIASAKVHVSAAEGFPSAVARPTTNCMLVVETSEPVTGTITVEVDSSVPSDKFL